MDFPPEGRAEWDETKSDVDGRGEFLLVEREIARKRMEGSPGKGDGSGEAPSLPRSPPQCPIHLNKFFQSQINAVSILTACLGRFGQNWLALLQLSLFRPLKGSEGAPSHICMMRNLGPGGKKLAGHGIEMEIGKDDRSCLRIHRLFRLADIFLRSGKLYPIGMSLR